MSDGTARPLAFLGADVARSLRPGDHLRHYVRLTTAARAKAVAGLDEVTRAALEVAERRAVEDGRAPPRQRHCAREPAQPALPVPGFRRCSGRSAILLEDLAEEVRDQPGGDAGGAAAGIELWIQLRDVKSYDLPALWRSG